MMTPEVVDPSVWAKLGPVGGILAFIVTSLWLYREFQFTKQIDNKDAQLKAKDDQVERMTTAFEAESRTWREAIGKQWRDTDAANREMYRELVSLAERVATALAELKTFLEGRMR